MFCTIDDEFVNLVKVGDNLLSLLSNIIIVDAFAVLLFLFLEKINNGLFFIDDGINHEIVHDTPSNRSDGDCEDEVNGPCHLIDGFRIPLVGS